MMLDQMKTRFKKDFLLSKLRENKLNHTSDYEKAVVVYLKDLKEQQDRIVAAVTALEMDMKFEYSVIHKIVYPLQTLQRPIDKTADYDTYISLIDASVEEDLELTMDAANCIINDSWDWLVSAKVLNSSYSSKFASY